MGQKIFVTAVFPILELFNEEQEILFSFWPNES
jgi:hypothetical protein